MSFKLWLREYALRKETVALFAILAAALAIRVLFFVGVNHQPDLTEAGRSAASAVMLVEAPDALGQALAKIRNEMGGTRNLIFYAPYITIYSVFGVTHASSMAIPILLSLVNIGLIFSITKLLLNERAALLATLLWAFFPLDVFYSTASMEIEPIFFFAMCALYLGTTVLRERRLKTGFLLGGSALVLALYEPWLVFPIAFYLTVQWLGDQSQSTRRKGSGIFFAATVLLIARPGTGDAFLSLYGLILDQLEFVFLLPLIFVSIATTLNNPQLRSSELFVWAGAVLIASIGKFLSTPILDGSGIFFYGPFFLFLFAPLIILVGSYIAGGLRAAHIPVVAGSLAIGAALAAGLALQGAEQFLPAFDNFSWLSLSSLFIFFFILAGVAFAASLASPLFLTGKNARWKRISTIGFLLVILLAGLPFTWKRVATFQYLVDAPDQAWQFLKNVPDLQIYTLSSETNNRLLFLSKTEGSNYETQSQVVQEQSEIQEGYLVAFENELSLAPPTWLRIGSFGALGSPRVEVYKVVSSQKASEAFRHAQASSTKSDIYELGVNATEFCVAYAAWAQIDPAAEPAINHISIQPSSDCFTVGSSVLHLEDLLVAHSMDGYLTFPSRVPDSDSPAITLAQISLPIYDKRTISINVELEPNTLYLYSVDILTISPTATLYWSLTGRGDYLEMRSYPEWTTISMLIRTPGWDHPETVSFSPALFDHIDPVSLRNLYLGQVDFK